MNSLFLELIKSMSVVAVSAYIFSQTKTFKSMITRSVHNKDKLIMVVFFTWVSILGTYMNIPVGGANANTRVIGAAVAGLYGGPLIGALVGLIAGFHRYMMGGFTALGSFMSTIAGGLIGGFFSRYSKNSRFDPGIGLLTGITAGIFQVVLIIILSRPLNDIVSAVRTIAIPMISANSIGIEIFINIIENALENMNRTAAIQMASAAELKALQAQIHPHFLFNALNTIASLCRTDPDKARELISNLATYFRKTLNREGSLVTIEEELDLVNSYLSIEKARFGDRLNIVYNVQVNLFEKEIPPFVIQPLVGNAVKHGVSPNPDGGSVQINVEEKDGFVNISVADTGIGMSEEKLSSVLRDWPGIGLKNVNERLRGIYGSCSELNIESKEGSGTKVSYRIPM